MPREIMHPKPINWRTAPATKVYAVLFRFELSFPVIIDPMDEQNRSGRSFRPAMMGELPSTIWNRCGKLMAAMKNVKPENNVDLRSIVSVVSRSGK